MSYRRLGLRSDHRRSVLRNSVTSLLKEEKISTTETRAKEIKRLTEKMITLGKRGDLHARRQAAAYIMSDEVVQKLFSDIAARYEERNGGYTRLVKTGYRKGDGAPMVMIELVE
ncbi:50S ribosomal protein L17 [Syntrophomonas wolfei]|uniref:Large ribosomal subunit protein bL17 n=1 Tax=Syntrophomonas wolfei subsp. wolfei (strain DSM 2245B / Goettingen) TaxID=335541 RepID=RL17_SYNWW|nr:50S ribosomal protein L17 [Syntrophomonas wolfei]Q0AUL0.1 RecName: Full=Large ribosomal subunit protein bL17; AltName: Full=50S ribosomal protein L17 [Syntrophomonas wolfei subsp. wolfei str. Goettingen G311]ABI69594.1 LSU ribosomal protein L17P [Syntrophomonas wolfei subsp. wolfei str. Goettingen G311]